MPFQHDIAGGQGNLIITALQSPNFEAGVQGWQVAKDGSAEFNNLVIRGTFFGLDFEINSSGGFFYTGTPAHGNLAISIASSSGTDGFGNPYTGPGVAIYGPNGSALGIFAVGAQPVMAMAPPGVAHQTQNAQVFCAATNAGLANEIIWLILSSGKTGGDDAALQLFSAAADGSTLAQAILEFGGTVALQVNKQNSTFTTGGGISGQPDISQTDISNHSATGTANTPITKAWTVPANDMQVGTVYRITSGGTGLWGTAQTLQAVGNLNGNNETGGGAAGRIAGAFLANATAFNWSAVYEFKVITTGTSGTARVRLTFTISSQGTALTPGTAAQNSMSVVTGPQAGAVTVNTTLATTLGLGAAWGGTTGSPTIGSADSTFERLGP